MIYMEHNLDANYHNADGAGDEKMKKDIIMSEIAKMIVNRPDRVITHLNEIGIVFKKTPNRRLLVKAVTHGMHSSKRFTVNMMTDVAGGGPKNGKMMSAEGGGAMECPPGSRRYYFGTWPYGYWGCTAAGSVGTKKPTSVHSADSWRTNIGTANDSQLNADSGAATTGGGGSINYTDLTKSVATLTGAIGSIFGGIKKKKDKSGSIKQKNTAEKDLLEKTEIIKDGGEKKSHIGRNIAIGVGVALAVGAGIMIYRSTRTKAAA